MYKYSNLNTNSLLYSLLGAGLAGGGTYGLYKLLTPKKHQTTGLGLSAAILGALGGGALGYMKHEDIRKAMLAAAEKLQKSISERVGKKIEKPAPSRPVTQDSGQSTGSGNSRNQTPAVMEDGIPILNSGPIARSGNSRNQTTSRTYQIKPFDDEESQRVLDPDNPFN